MKIIPYVKIQFDKETLLDSRDYITKKQNQLNIVSRQESSPLEHALDKIKWVNFFVNMRYLFLGSLEQILQTISDSVKNNN